MIDTLHISMLLITLLAIIAWLCESAVARYERAEKERYRGLYDEMCRRDERRRSEVDAADWWKPEGWQMEDDS